ncbi:MAG: hypothetical protein ACKOEX_01850 [Planctomycetia bacterium]
MSNSTSVIAGRAERRFEARAFQWSEILFGRMAVLESGARIGLVGWCGNGKEWMDITYR